MSTEVVLELIPTFSLLLYNLAVMSTIIVFSAFVSRSINKKESVYTLLQVSFNWFFLPVILLLHLAALIFVFVRVLTFESWVDISNFLKFIVVGIDFFSLGLLTVYIVFLISVLRTFVVSIWKVQGPRNKEA